MPDREKVVKALEYCVLSDDCRPCEYWMEFNDTGCQIMKDALVLLKEQEAERDAKVIDEMVKPTKCPCGELFDAKDSSFCPKCGCAYGELSGRYTNIGR